MEEIWAEAMGSFWKCNVCGEELSKPYNGEGDKSFIPPEVGEEE